MRKQALFITFPICICILIAGAWLADAGPPDLNPPPGTVGVSGRFGTRTAILKLPFTITECGSYFLTGCLTGEANRDGITIEADDVTLDLNGFSLIGVGGSFDGVAVPATRTNLVIRNGTVRNWGNDGVDTIRAQNSQLQDLRASGNGVNGLRIGAGGLVTHCTVTENGAFGIFADSGSTVQDCSARNNLGGISVGTGCTVQGCSAYSNDDDGFSLVSGSTISGCTASSNTGDGIQASNDCRIIGNTCVNNGAFGGDGAGIHTTLSDNRIESNLCTDATRGLDIDGSGNYVADNTVKDNDDNYDIAAGNQLNILLCELPESIDWSAKVTLAGSLTGVTGQNGITINVDDVTIDLNGFALIGVAGSLDGIDVPAAIRNLTVRNGTISDWGANGVSALSASNSQLERLRASDNGSQGLVIGTGSLVTQCTAKSNGSDGIAVSGGSTVQNCSAIANDDDGFSLGQGVTIAVCTAKNNTGDGIQANGDCLIIGNTCDSNGFGAGDGAGIHNINSHDRIEGNNVTDNDRGIEVDVPGNIIIKNTASGNTTNYDIAVGNNYGEIIVNPGGAFDGSATNFNPWANFEY